MKYVEACLIAWDDRESSGVSVRLVHVCLCAGMS